MPESIHLHGLFAKQFLKNKVGDKVSLAIDGELRDIGVQRIGGPGELRKNRKEAMKTFSKMEAHVEIYIHKLNGKSGKNPKDMSDDEVEEENAKVKGY